MLIYVASPYTHRSVMVRHDRYVSVEAYCRWRLVDYGEAVFSPIVYLHNMARRFDMPQESEFYRQLNYDFLEHCGFMRVLMLPGWQESAGVADEIAEAERLGIPVEYVNP